MPVFPSEEWLTAASWEGDLAYVFEREPDKGLPDDVWVWIDLWHGKCRGARQNVPQEEGEKAKFIIRAPYSRWKEVIKGELDPIKGMMQGKLKLKGDLPTLVRYNRAATELVNIAASVPTEFIDEK